MTIHVNDRPANSQEPDCLKIHDLGKQPVREQVEFGGHDIKEDLTLAWRRREERMPGLTLVLTPPDRGS